MRERKVLVLSDADNTLWDTDSVYAKAQERLLESVEIATGLVGVTSDRLGFVREVDQDIAKIHHGRLRYPTSLLARALSLRLQGVTSLAAARIVCRSHDARELEFAEAERVESQFHHDLRMRPPLRRGVMDGVKGIHGLGLRVLIVTEGHKTRCAELLKSYGLESYTEGLIEAPKQAALYRRLVNLRGGIDRGFMIGDQLDRDIAPAKEAGLTTIYFPSGFVPKWAPNKAVVLPSYEITSFEEVPKIVEAELENS